MWVKTPSGLLQHPISVPLGQVPLDQEKLTRKVMVIVFLRMEVVSPLITESLVIAPDLSSRNGLGLAALLEILILV